MTTSEPSPPPPASPSSRPKAEVYHAAFWIAFAANLLVVSSNALTFRFAELVNFLGGTEGLAGLTVSVATFGAVAARFKIGEAIDRLGVRKVWAACSATGVSGALVLAAAGPLAEALPKDAGPVLAWLGERLPIFLGRLLFTVGLAGQFGCSLVHIQNIVPARRRTEAIATFGSSGFLGMMSGTILGDVIFYQTVGADRYLALFGASAACGTIYLLFTLYLTRSYRHDAPDERTGSLTLLRRYWPGPVTLVGGAMGLGFAVSTVFLTRFATARGLPGIFPFFMGYAISAFTFRVLTRRWSQKVGRHRMIDFGLAGQMLGFLCLPLVSEGWHLVPPAILVGFGHALLFPAVVSLGTETFPLRYRGTASTLILGFFDLGMLICAPVLGGMVDLGVASGLSGGTEFIPMFVGAALLDGGIGLYYHLAAGRREDVDVLAEAEKRGELHGTPERTAPPTGRFEPIGPRAERAGREPIAAGR
ncbi:MFS transporter [Alienimonas sp. DA493]